MAILLLASSQFATQLFLPALPNVAKHFALSTADAQQVMMLFYMSFGASQLWYGPWTDAVGLRRVFVLGQSLFLCGSVLCYLAYSVEWLAIGRLLQGVGAGATLILSRVILSTSMQGIRLQKAFASLAITASVVALCAPVIGGWLTSLFNWQAAFLVFVVYVMVVSVAGFFILPYEGGHGAPLAFKSVAASYRMLLQDKRFYSAAAFKWWPSLLFMCSGTFLPFAIQQGFALTPSQYGTYMMFPALGLVIGSGINRVMQKHHTPLSVIAYFWPLMVVCGLLLVTFSDNLWMVLLAYSCFMLLCGAYYANALHLAIEPFKANAGTASALLGAIDMLVISILAALINRFWVTSITALGVLFLTCSVIIAVNWAILQAHRRAELIQQSQNSQNRADEALQC